METNPIKVYRANCFGAAGVYPEGKGGYPLDPRFDLRNHSPTGFAWGYAGSGPAQFALAILADHLSDTMDKTAAGEAALRLYQRFKFEVIARKSRSLPFVLTSAEVARFVEGA